MFEELIREISKLHGQHEISIGMPLDDNGFFDRECPNEECGRHFKVLFEDWKTRVADERVFCPFCRHEAPAEEWNTPEQVEHIKSAGTAAMTRMVQDALQRGVRRSRPKRIDAGPFGISMKLGFEPGDIPPVIPASPTDALRQEFACEACGCRYASLGASFFCPACGHNSAATSFNNTLATVRKAVGALGSIQEALEQTLGPDAARDTVRQLLEDQFARLLGAFERFNEALFHELPAAAAIPRRGAVFQRVDDASALWAQATGKSYEDFLSPEELRRMNLLFQRRHVLSHRQGIVDQQYIDRSGDMTYAVGQRLIAKESDVLELVDLVEKLTTGLRRLVVEEDVLGKD